jgi:hypothetical protein
LDRKSIELGKEFEKNLTRESNELRDFVLKKKGEIEENYLQNLKDLENKMSIKWNNMFDNYRIKFEDAMREFNTLKNDLLLIKKDYLNSLARLEDKLTNKLNRDLENMRGQFVNRMGE